MLTLIFILQIQQGDATISPSAHIASVPTAAVENGVDDDEEEAESEVS